MSAVESAFAVGLGIAIACMVIIELKPRASPAFTSVLNAVLIGSAVVVACVAGLAVWGALPR